MSADARGVDRSVKIENNLTDATTEPGQFILNSAKLTTTEDTRDVNIGFSILTQWLPTSSMRALSSTPTTSIRLGRDPPC